MGVATTQTTDAGIFEARSGTSNIRLDVRFMAETSRIKVSACAVEAATNRRRTIDCIDPPPCTLVGYYTVVKGTEYDITIKWTGGKVVFMAGVSSENHVTYWAKSCHGN